MDSKQEKLFVAQFLELQKQNHKTHDLLNQIATLGVYDGYTHHYLQLWR